MPKESFVKLRTSPKDSEPFASENLFAIPLGSDQYELANIPIISSQLNYMDVVEAHPNANGALQITKIVSRSGHRTTKCSFGEIAEGDPRRKQALKAIKDAGGGSEGGFGMVIASTFKPEVCQKTINELLDKLEELGIEVYEQNLCGSETYE